MNIAWDEWRGSLDGRPTMWIKRLAACRGWVLDIHKFVGADDPGCFHTHPAWALRIVLWGGYTEEINTGFNRTFKPGHIGIVEPWLSHRIASLRGEASYSLWLRAPKCADVQLHGDGWAKQQTSSKRVCATCEYDGSSLPPCSTCDDTYSNWTPKTPPNSTPTGDAEIDGAIKTIADTAETLTSISDAPIKTNEQRASLWNTDEELEGLESARTRRSPICEADNTGK